MNLEDLNDSIKKLQVRINQEDKLLKGAEYMLQKLPSDKQPEVQGHIKETQDRLDYLISQMADLQVKREQLYQIKKDKGFERSQSAVQLSQEPSTNFGFMRADKAITKQKVHYLHSLALFLLGKEQPLHQGLLSVVALHNTEKAILDAKQEMEEGQARIFILQRTITFYNQLDFNQIPIDFDQVEKIQYSGKLTIQVLKLEGLSGKRSEKSDLFVKVRVDNHLKMQTRPSRTSWNDQVSCQLENATMIEIAIYESMSGIIAMTFFQLNDFIQDANPDFESDFKAETTCSLHLFPTGSVQTLLSFQGRKPKKQHKDGIQRQSLVQKKFLKQRHVFEPVSTRLLKCGVCHEFIMSNPLCCTYCHLASHKNCIEFIGVPHVCKVNMTSTEDQEELMVKHNIPHRFQKATGLAVNWCVHCGKMVPLGKNSHMICGECGVACHINCEQCVPNYCGLPPRLLAELSYVANGRTKSASTKSQDPIPNHSRTSTSAKLKSAESTIILDQFKKSRQDSLNYFRHGSKGVGLDDFTFLAVLGKGNFGKVMLAQEKFTDRYYAIKVLKKEFILEHDEVVSTKSEKHCFQIATKEMHPFLVHLHSCFQTESRLYFVMEFVCGGDLMYHIQQKKFTPQQAKFYACEVLLAIEYWHRNDILYRDLKLDNILLSTDGHVKIADYGLCKMGMSHGVVTNTFCGTPEFMAPEILSEQPYTRAVDWWSFGVLVYEMLLGKVFKINQAPFAGDNEEKIFNAILTKQPIFPANTDPAAVELMQKLLHKSPKKRLGASPLDAQEIKAQEYFKGVNWEDVYYCRIPPPFSPMIKSQTDTSNFDPEFTNEVPVLTPVHSVLSRVHQEEFRGFTYVTEWAKKSREAVLSQE